MLALVVQFLDRLMGGAGLVESENRRHRMLHNRHVFYWELLQKYHFADKCIEIVHLVSVASRVK